MVILLDADQPDRVALNVRQIEIPVTIVRVALRPAWPGHPSPGKPGRTPGAMRPIEISSDFSGCRRAGPPALRAAGFASASLRESTG
jgi:hypothetical protein